MGQNHVYRVDVVLTHLFNFLTGTLWELNKDSFLENNAYSCIVISWYRTSFPPVWD